jgi:hypothetical protein
MQIRKRALLLIVHEDLYRRMEKDLEVATDRSGLKTNW